MAANFWHGKRVFVTGITGFLGAWIGLELVKRGAQVVGLVRDLVPESNFNLSGLSKQVTVVMGSLDNFEVVSRAFLDYDVEYCFHVAAQSIVGHAKDNPLFTFESNIKGTWNVLDAARRAPAVKGVVVASSDKAYGTQTLPYREEFPLLGENPYDVSKACTDYIARAYAKTYGMPVAVTRCANLFGGGDLNFSRVVPGTIRSLLLDQAPLIRSDGTPLRDYLYVQDAVQAYLMVTEQIDRPEVKGEAFNFGMAQPVSVLDVVNRLIKISQRQIRPDILGKGKLAGEIDQQYLSTDKAKRIFGWKPSITMNDALQETYDWYSEFFNSHRNFVLESVNRGN